MDELHAPLPDPELLIPVESELWTETGAVPDAASVVVRGGPITPDKLFAHAARQAREYSLGGHNMASVSVDLVLPDWPLERILAGQLATYSRFATCTVAALVDAGFDVLATGCAPHADVVLSALTIVEATRLSDLLAEDERRNPYKGGGDRDRRT